MSQQHKIIAYSITAFIGIIATGVFWYFWLQSLQLIVEGTTQNAFSLIGWTVILLLVLVTFNGITGLLLPYSRYRFVLYAIWPIGILFEYINTQVVLAFGLYVAVYLLFIGIDWGIWKRSKALIEPVLSMILPGMYRLWMVLFSVILSISIAIHPGIRINELQINIPEQTWTRIWNLLGLRMEGQNMLPERSQITNTNQAGSVEGIFDTLLQQLNASGIAVNESTQAEIYERLQNSDQNEIQGYLDTINQQVSTSIKQEVEKLLTNTVAPYAGVWAYIIALSFFLSAQFLAPLIGWLGLFTTKLCLWLLVKTGVAKLEEQQVTARRYMLQ